jgi:hypothetical protein
MSAEEVKTLKFSSCSCLFAVSTPFLIFEVFLGIVIGDKHHRVCKNCTWYTGREPFPESKPAAFISVNVESALDHSSIRNKTMVFVELKWYLSYLQLGLDDVLRVRYEPCKEASHAASDKLRSYSQFMSVLQSV